MITAVADNSPGISDEYVEIQPNVKPTDSSMNCSACLMVAPVAGMKEATSAIAIWLQPTTIPTKRYAISKPTGPVFF